MRLAGIGAAALLGMLAGAAWLALPGSAQEAGRQLPLREVARYGGVRGDLHVTRIGWAVSAPSGTVFVSDLDGLHVIEADWQATRQVAEGGGGPGSIARIGAVWVQGDFVNVADQGQNLIHAFTWDGEFVEARSLPTATDVTLAAYRPMRAGTGFGWSIASRRYSVFEGEVDVPGKLVWIRGEAVELLAEYTTVAPIWYQRTTHGQMGKWTRSMVGHSAQWDVLGDSAVVVADALSGLLSWHRLGADGLEQYRVSDSGIPGVALSRRERSQVIASEREFWGSRFGFTSDTEVWFPERITGIVDLLADGEGCLWLRRRPPLGHPEANSWRVVAPDGGRWADMLLPEGLTVKEIGADRILGVVTDDFDAPIVVMYEFDRAALMDAMAPAPQRGED